MTDRPATEPRLLRGHPEPCDCEWHRSRRERAEAAQGAAPQPDGTDAGALANILDEAKGGGWKPEDGTSLWFVNEAGDQLRLTGDDVALLLNSSLEQAAPRTWEGDPFGLHLPEETVKPYVQAVAEAAQGAAPLTDRQRLNDEYMRGYRAASAMLDSIEKIEGAAPRAEEHRYVRSTCKPSDPDDCRVECSCGESGSDAWWERHRAAPRAVPRCCTEPQDHDKHIEGAAPRAEGLDVERLARAIQATILTTPDQFMGPGMGAYRQPWDEMADHEQRAVIRDAEALADEYAHLSRPSDEREERHG